MCCEGGVIVALRQLLLIQPKLVLTGAIVLLIALVFTLVLDGGTASAATCEYISTREGSRGVCSRTYMEMIAYAWDFWF